MVGAVLGLIVLSSPQVSDTVLPTGARVRPAGSVVIVPGRPVDAVFSPDGTRAFVKDNQGVRILDPQKGTLVGNVACPGGTSLTGLAISRDGKRLYVTGATTKLHEIDIEVGTPKIVRSIELPGPEGKGNSFPCGLALSQNGSRAYVCLSRNNSLAEVDLESGKFIREVPVGIAPYTVVLTQNDRQATVSLMGGPLETSAKMAPSAGTPVPVDERGVAVQGGIAVVDVPSFQRIRVQATPRQTSALAVTAAGKVAVTHSNDDKIAVYDPTTGTFAKSVDVKPDPKLPFGSMPSALATVGDLGLVALAGNNAVALLNMSTGQVRGYIPTGWYPTAVARYGDRLMIASSKGLGARRSTRPAPQGRNSYDYAATVQFLNIPQDAELRKLTRQVKEDAQMPQILRAFERVKRSTAKPVPVPKRLGDPSVFQHVVYVIKENRTYDQVFGDMKQGDGDPKLCIYGEEITPNHHAIAREYALLDNYYCNGVLSADGHSWATEGNVTPYLERAFGGFNRSYTFGDDPLTYSSSGFVWDRVLEGGLSFRNFGEMDYAEPPKGMRLADLLKGRGGEYPKFTHNIGVERLRRYSDPEYPGWNMEIPDVVRIDRFLTELKRFEREGSMPNFTIVYLPQDHGGSSVTNRANVADNDLAVGMLIEGLSKSKFWPKTAVFINEDDPQGGFDHVDGHRSVCLVVSPYTRGRGTVKAFSNQTTVIHTMLRILGVPPLNQKDAASPLMTACFGPKADLTPYKARPARIALDETKVPGRTVAFERYSAKVKARIAKIPLGHKTPADEDVFNRLLWHEAKGLNARYPAEFAGPHGKGLKRRGLIHAEVRDED